MDEVEERAVNAVRSRLAELRAGMTAEDVAAFEATAARLVAQGWTGERVRGIEVTDEELAAMIEDDDEALGVVRTQQSR
jgi:hypothetical protein